MWYEWSSIPHVEWMLIYSLCIGATCFNCIVYMQASLWHAMGGV